MNYFKETSDQWGVLNDTTTTTNNNIYVSVLNARVALVPPK